MLYLTTLGQVRKARRLNDVCLSDNKYRSMPHGVRAMQRTDDVDYSVHATMLGAV